MIKHPEQAQGILQELLTQLDQYPVQNDDLNGFRERVHSLRNYLVGVMPAEYAIELPLAKEAASALEGDRYSVIKDLINRLE